MSQISNNFTSAANTAGNLNGFFKETYADKLKDLIPDGVKIMNKIKFIARDKMPGNLYHAPVILGMEHGVTFGAPEDDAMNLNAPVSGNVKDATVRGNPMVLRSQLGYTAASRAATSKGAFMDATKYLVSNMLRSLTKKLEIMMVYGQEGYGTVASVAGNVVTITTAEWAPGIWAGSEKMPIEIYDAASVAFPPAGVLKGASEVVSIDMDLRTVTLQSAPVGLVAGDVIFHKGAYGKEFAGIRRILRQSAGTLFGINVAEFNLFRGNIYNVGATALSFPKLNLAASRAVEKGVDGDMFALINVRAWANILNDQAALREYDVSYSKEKLEQGSKGIVFYSQNGKLEIEPSIYVKEGDAFLLSVDEWERVGSSDVTFEMPGNQGQYIVSKQESTAYELRLWSEQALFCRAPGRNVYLTGIVNAT